MSVIEEPTVLAVVETAVVEEIVVVSESLVNNDELVLLASQIIDDKVVPVEKEEEIIPKSIDSGLEAKIIRQVGDLNLYYYVLFIFILLCA